MAINLTIILVIVAVLLFLSTIASVCVNILFVWRFPFIVKGIFAQRFVFFCGIDGSLRPEPARVEGYGMRTDSGMYNFDREDVVTFCGVPSIIVYRPIAKAIRPPIAPIFRKLKKAGIKNKNAYKQIVESKPMTVEEFNAQFEVTSNE